VPSSLYPELKKASPKGDAIPQRFITLPHLPILVGKRCSQNRQVSWLMVINTRAFPSRLATVAFCGCFPFTVAGPRRICTGLPFSWGSAERSYLNLFCSRFSLISIIGRLFMTVKKKPMPNY